MNYQKLFEYLQREHNATLLESDINEIVNIVNEMQQKQPVGDAEIEAIGTKLFYTVGEDGISNLHDFKIGFCKAMELNNAIDVDALFKSYIVEHNGDHTDVEEFVNFIKQQQPICKHEKVIFIRHACKCESCGRLIETTTTK